MADRRMEKIRALARAGEYRLSGHVLDKIEANDFENDYEQRQMPKL